MSDFEESSSAPSSEHAGSVEHHSTRFFSRPVEDSAEKRDVIQTLSQAVSGTALPKFRASWSLPSSLPSFSGFLCVIRLLFRFSLAGKHSSGIKEKTSIAISGIILGTKPLQLLSMRATSRTGHSSPMDCTNNGRDFDFLVMYCLVRQKFEVMYEYIYARPESFQDYRRPW